MAGAYPARSAQNPPRWPTPRSWEGNRAPVAASREPVTNSAVVAQADEYVDLPIDELRSVARYAAHCAQSTLPLFHAAHPDDRRADEAIEAATRFADGDRRSRLQRAAAVAARAAARQAATPAASHAALAAAAASSAAYLHPLARASQLKHILGAAAHAARAAELAAGDDAIVGLQVLERFRAQAAPELVAVLRRYPTAPTRGNRVAQLLGALDCSLRAAGERFFHGTRATLSVGDLIGPGFRSNFGTRRVANHVYLTATLDAAIWGAELADGDGPGHIYQVEPTGLMENDPNLTDKKFPGNITRSYRTRYPVRVVGEVLDWTGHPAEVLQTMRDNVARLAAMGVEAID